MCGGGGSKEGSVGSYLAYSGGIDLCRAHFIFLLQIPINCSSIKMGAVHNEC